MENKNMVKSMNIPLHTCQTCKKSFNHSNSLIKHELTHKNLKLQKPKAKRKKLNFTNSYCDICCRHYASMSSLNCHYKRTHLQSYKEHILTVYNEDDRFYKPKTNNLKFIHNPNIFKEFENKLPPEFKFDQYRCNICNYKSINLDEYMEHESSHYQPNLNINYLTRTLTDNPSIENTQNAITNSHGIQNNENENGNVSTNYQTINVNKGCCTITSKDSFGKDDKQNENEYGTSGLANKNIKTLEDVPHDVPQQVVNYDYCAPSTSKDNLINVCHNKIKCAICNDEYTEHEYNNHINNNHLNFYISIKSNECENILANMINTKKSLKEPDEDPLKELNIIPQIIEPFKCDLCNTMCELPEHFEVYGWLHP